MNKFINVIICILFNLILQNVSAQNTNKDFYIGSNERFCPENPVIHHPDRKYEWDFGNGQKSTERSPCVVYTQSGVYKITFKTCTNCTSGSSTKSMTVHVDGGEKNIVDTKGELYCYPNPATDIINITVQPTIVNYEIYLVSVNGRIADKICESSPSKTINGKHSININKYVTGSYKIVLINLDTKKRYTQPLVIK